MKKKLAVSLVIFVATSLAGPSVKAEDGGKPVARKSRYSFYYTIPEELSARDGWAYAVPDCKVIAADREKPKTCEYIRKRDMRTCTSSELTKVTNAESGEERNVSLRYLFFNTLAACDKDRALYLAGDGGDY